MLLSSTDALLRQQTRLLFNQLHRLCAELSLMHRSQGSVPGSVISAERKKTNKQHYANAISAAKWGRWVTERDGSSEQSVSGEGKKGGLGHDKMSVLYFALNPRESAETTQRGCVVTPWTRRTLPSQNSTFVMSCSRGCSPAPTDLHIFIAQQHGWPLSLAESHGNALKVTPPRHKGMWKLTSCLCTEAERATKAPVSLLTKTPPSCSSWRKI